jgi:hypothetical protein
LGEIRVGVLDLNGMGGVPECQDETNDKMEERRRHESVKQLLPVGHGRGGRYRENPKIEIRNPKI